ncbi:MAG: hypothetical protein ACXVHX_27015 [Solirubrobacteraceae bacterium]
MNFRSKRMLVVAATTLAVVGGGAAAVAATSSGSRGSDFLDSVAKHLGVTPQKLEDATKAAAVDQVNADLAAGRITQAQADALKKRIEAGNGVLGGPGGPGFGRGPGGPGFGGPPGPGFGRPAIANEVAAAAKYLGLSEADLRTKLGDGQSLADVAKAQNKDVKGVEDAIVASQKARLDQAVSDKKLTQSEADDILAKLKAHVDDLVNAKPADRPSFRGRRGAGPRFFFGP